MLWLSSSFCVFVCVKNCVVTDVHWQCVAEFEALSQDQRRKEREIVRLRCVALFCVA